MSTIALQDGKVVLKDGMASCTCCGGCNFGAICINGYLLVGNWNNVNLGVIGRVCSLRVVLEDENIGMIDIIVFTDIGVTEIYGAGLNYILNNCCFGNCFAYRQYGQDEHPVFGTYQINTYECGIVQLTLYKPPC